MIGSVPRLNFLLVCMKLLNEGENQVKGRTRCHSTE